MYDPMLTGLVVDGHRRDLLADAAAHRLRRGCRTGTGRWRWPRRLLPPVPRRRQAGLPRPA
jgi:hypothetical protein